MPVERRKSPGSQRLQAQAAIAPPTDTDEGVPSGSKGLAHQLFGDAIADAMAFRAGRGKRFDYRAIFEPTDASTQCERVIGLVVPEQTPCYLCGEAIPDPRSLKGGPKHELYPECEHILPVTQARAYLDLYMATRPPADDWHRKALEYEYAYAHRVCNQAKSNDSFVRDENRNPVIDEAGTQKILKAIRKRAKDDLRNPPPAGVVYSAAHKIRLATISETILSRKDTIIGNNIQRIIDHATGAPADLSLRILQQTALMTDPVALRKDVREELLKSAAKTPAEIATAEEESRNEFRRQIYIEYPQFRPDFLERLILDRIIAPRSGWGGIDGNAVFGKNAIDSILDKYIAYRASIKTNSDRKTPKGSRGEEKDEEPYDPSGIILITAVWFGVYLNLFNQLDGLMVTEAVPPKNSVYAPSLCSVYTHMRAVMSTSQWINIRGMFKELPNFATVEAFCSELGFAVTPRGERQATAEAKAMAEEEERLLQDVEEIIPASSPEEDARYYFDGLAAELVNSFNFAPETATEIENTARQAFVEAISNGRDVQTALNESADAVDSFVALAGIRGDPRLSEIIAHVATFIRTLRTGDVAIASDEDVEAMQQPVSNAAVGIGAGAGPGGIPELNNGKRTGGRRPLYG